MHLLKFIQNFARLPYPDTRTKAPGYYVLAKPDRTVNKIDRIGTVGFFVERCNESNPFLSLLDSAP